MFYRKYVEQNVQLPLLRQTKRNAVLGTELFIDRTGLKQQTNRKIVSEISAPAHYGGQVSILKPGRTEKIEGRAEARKPFLIGSNFHCLFLYFLDFYNFFMVSNLNLLRPT